MSAHLHPQRRSRDRRDEPPLFQWRFTDCLKHVAMRRKPSAAAYCGERDRFRPGLRLREADCKDQIGLGGLSTSVVSLIWGLMSERAQSLCCFFLVLFFKCGGALRSLWAANGPGSPRQRVSPQIHRARAQRVLPVAPLRPTSEAGLRAGHALSDARDIESIQSLTSRVSGF